jgi:small multidrug resistance pump
MAWVFLSAAIVVELCATIGLKYSEGFTRPLVVVGVLGGYGLSFLLMSRAVRAGMEITTGYAIWSGIGTAALVVIGASFLGEPLTLAKTAGIGLVVVGVIVLSLAGTN